MEAGLVGQPYWVVGVCFVWLAVCAGLGAHAVFWEGPPPDRRLED